MGIVHSPSSELGRELRKWEQHHTVLSVTEDGNSLPGNPYVYRPYPRMLYKATKRSNGQYACFAPVPSVFDFDKQDAFERAVLEKEMFDKSCQRIAKSEEDERIAKGQGWAESPSDALQLAEAQELALSTAAAEAIYAAQRMSESARAEFAAADAATGDHITDVPVKRGRGRAAE